MTGPASPSAAATGLHPRTGQRGFDASVFSVLPEVQILLPPQRGFSVLTLDFAGGDIEAQGSGEGAFGIVYALQRGPIEVAIGGPRRRYEVAEPCIGVLPEGAWNEWKTREPFRTAHLMIDAPSLAEWAERDDIGGHPAAVRPGMRYDDTSLDRLVHNVLAELARPGLYSSALIDAYALAFAVLLLRGAKGLEPPAGACARRVALAPWRLARAKEFIEAHLAEDVGLHEIAAAAGLSPFHFARGFKHATGLAPYRYLVLRRIERGRRLLETTALPIAGIAVACGYSAQQAFTAAFGRVVGTSPARYRAERQERPE